MPKIVGALFVWTVATTICTGDLRWQHYERNSASSYAVTAGPSSGWAMLAPCYLLRGLHFHRLSQSQLLGGPVYLRGHASETRFPVFGGFRGRRRRYQMISAIRVVLVR